MSPKSGPKRLPLGLIILLGAAIAGKLDDLTSRESFTVGELRKIRHEHCKGHIPGHARRDDVAADTKNFIEARNARGELDRALTYASIVADLEVLGSCDAIVGTAASWVSRLIFLLIVGNTGRTPPHVFLDQRFGGPADVW